MKRVKSASLCPLRSTPDGIEVLLTRRAFWNTQKQRPMTYPGEWAFSGGSYEEGDSDLLHTAMREFREELGYEGSIDTIRELRSCSQESHGRLYDIDFYAASIQQAEMRPNTEVIGVAWMRPQDALRYISSESFTREQEREFKRLGLDDPKYDLHQVTQRQFPQWNVATLQQIMEMPGLVDVY